jgi:hypothetical protein
MNVSINMGCKRVGVALGFAAAILVAALWFPAPSAFAQALITNVVPSFEVTTFSVGVEYYGDRTYTITSMPSELVGAEGIKTDNDDENNVSANYVQFDLTQYGEVYIAYDNRASSLPDWMSEFSATGGSIGVTDTSASPLQLYKKTFGPGQVVLGGNMGASTGADSNYIVLALPLDPEVHVSAPYFIEEGDTLTMTAVVRYLDGTIEYQWSKLGVGDLGGETGPSMTINPVAEIDEGYYQVEVWVGVGDHLLSAARFVEVVAPGTIPVAGAVGLGVLVVACAVAGVVGVRRRNC